MLALRTLERPELVIIDEPTNHLDIDSIEALEHMLSTYLGALLLASHNSASIASTTNVTWRIKTSKDAANSQQVRYHPTQTTLQLIHAKL